MTSPYGVLDVIGRSLKPINTLRVTMYELLTELEWLPQNLASAPGIKSKLKAIPGFALCGRFVRQLLTREVRTAANQNQHSYNTVPRM